MTWLGVLGRVGVVLALLAGCTGGQPDEAMTGSASGGSSSATSTPPTETTTHAS
ncbi:MAG: hypothetical protein IE926_10110 [Micrococcales bacterium]|nr:hypothetical protein [Micrococcales bacterium]